MFIDIYRQLPGLVLLRKVLVVAASAAALLASTHLEAAQQRFSEQDFAMAPQYCRYTPGFVGRIPGSDNPAELQRWKTVLGYMYAHMHHYCMGVMYTNKALVGSRSERERMQNLRGSIGEIEYVLRRAKPDYMLVPEFLYRRGDNLVRLNRAAEGVTDLQRAIELKPDYWPAYASLSDYYKAGGDKAKAREWLEKGLAAAPGAKALQSRLAELGGAGGKGSAAAPPARPAMKPPPAEPPAAESAPAEKPGAEPAAER